MNIIVLLLHCACVTMHAYFICRCEDCGTMYTYLKHFLKDAFIYPRGGPAIPGHRFCEIYTRASTTGMKEQIIEAFQKESSSLRVVFATIAFGMGLDIPDIEQAIHVGPSTDIEDYAQEIGRIGRNNVPSKAILIAKYNRHASEEMKAYVWNSTECRRLYIYKKFLRGESAKSNNPLCSCCDVCSKACKCGGCNDSVFKNKFLY